MNKEQVIAFCTTLGMPTQLMNELVACIEVESNFDQYAIHLNKNPDGTVSTIDYGIVQINDYWHIAGCGKGNDFPSVEYVLSNPEACVKWMAKLFMEGQQKLWDSYLSGAYLKYMPKVVPQ